MKFYTVYRPNKAEYKIRAFRRLARQPGWLMSRLLSGAAAISFTAILLLGAAADTMDTGTFLKGVFAAGTMFFLALALKSAIDGETDNG